MFGLGFGEMVVLGVVLLVVVGPRELPKLLRSLGRGINKLRSMSTDLRRQSGIDDIINEEGLREDLDAIRSLSKGRLLEGALNAATTTARRPPQRTRPRSTAPTLEELTLPAEGEAPPRDVEYPAVGCDAYGALADDAEPVLPTEPADVVPPEEEDISDEDDRPPEEDIEDSDPYAGADTDVKATQEESA